MKMIEPLKLCSSEVGVYSDDINALMELASFHGYKLKDLIKLDNINLLKLDNINLCGSYIKQKIEELDSDDERENFQNGIITNVLCHSVKGKNVMFINEKWAEFRRKIPFQRSLHSYWWVEREYLLSRIQVKAYKNVKDGGFNEITIPTLEVHVKTIIEKNIGFFSHPLNRLMVNVEDIWYNFSDIERGISKEIDVSEECDHIVIIFYPLYCLISNSL